MDTHIRLDQEESTGDEDDFSGYMDENGIIRMEEQEERGLDDQEIVAQEEQGTFELPEQRLLGLNEKLILGLQEQDISYPDPPSDEDRSDMQSWEEHFSFSQMGEERSQDLLEFENSNYCDDMTEQPRMADDLNPEDHPDISLSLPPLSDWRPPSRDQQLDMTEDERDRGSSIGKSEEEGEDPESYSQSQYDLPYDDSQSPEGYEDYLITTAGEDDHDSLPILSVQESYFKNPGTHEDEPSTFSLSPSPHPRSDPWGPRLLNQLGGLNMSPRIEDETLPESSCTDSADAHPTTSTKDFERVGFNKTKIRTEPAYPSPTPPRILNAGDTKTKSSKPSPAPLYGRGQLNYPLPDLSKVGPRVKFPRDDQSYRPPQSRKLDAQKTTTPIIFKSPAEIVREVLQSSTDSPVQELIVPRIVPQEFQNPQQATELVHQLQEDYHKLLTKYAEAENTIDRLRLGAKINLYSDPPKPSHSVQMGTVHQGAKIMEFTIPQVQKAAFSLVNEQDGITPESLGSPAPAGSPLPEMSSSSPYNTHEDIPNTLTCNIELLQRELDHFEKLLHKGSLTPAEQQQALLELRGSLDMLEQQYLKAQGQYRQRQQYTGPGDPSEELDASRALETAIYHLGIHMDELQDKVQDSVLRRHSPGLAINSNTERVADPSHTAPVPSALAPVPALITPYPEVLPPTRSSAHIETDGNKVNKEEPVAAEELPQPLLHKQIQVEQEYDTLLSTYNNFKTLPNVLGLEQDEWPLYHQKEARPLHHLQMTASQDQPKPDRSEVHFQIMDQPPPEKPRNYSRSVRLFSHPNAPGHNGHSHDLTPRSQQQSARLQDSPRVSAPQKSDHAEVSKPGTRRSSTHKNMATPKEHQQDIHGWDSKKSSPGAGNYSKTRSMPKTSKTTTQHISPSSPSMSQLRETSSRSRTNNPSVSGDSMRGAYSRRSSISGKSVSSSARKEQVKAKGVSMQDRIVSPETDSGFLGSESGQSPLRKQGNQLQQIREAPPAPFASPPNSPRTTGIQLSRMESEKIRAARASWGKRVRNNHWLGPSETSSPSPGPKSLTESESREQSHASDTDTERDRDSVMNSNGSQITLSPLRDSSQHLRKALETRTARDQAIQDLQKEVIQLRQHLEGGLSHTPTQENPAETQRSPTLQSLRKERSPHFARDHLTSPSSKEDLKEPRAELSKSNNVVQDSGLGQSSQGRHVYGDYTGTLYNLPESSSNHRDQPGITSYCKRCQDSSRRSPGHVRAPPEAESSCPVHSSCPLCIQSSDSAETPRIEHSSHHMSKRRQRSLRVPPCGHCFWNQTPPVTYLQSPLISYSPPVIYGPSPNLYLPMAYSMPERRHQRTLTPPPSPLNIDDLHWPLNRALEAATELKLTSKRMCHSLTSDLSFQRSLRGSCLF